MNIETEKSSFWLSQHLRQILCNVLLIVITAAIASFITYKVILAAQSRRPATPQTPTAPVPAKHASPELSTIDEAPKTVRVSPAKAPGTTPGTIPEDANKYFDLSHARIHNANPCRNLDLRYKTPKGWGVQGYWSQSYRNATVAIKIADHLTVWIGMDENDLNKASSYIVMSQFPDMTAEDFDKLPPERLKKLIRRNLYVDYILTSSRTPPGLEMEKDFGRLSDEKLENNYRNFMKLAQKLLPEESIKVADFKKTTVSGYPALYTEIVSPLTHQRRRLLYYLIAIRKNNYCFSILMDADEKEFPLRKKQFAAFLAHMDF